MKANWLIAMSASDERSSVMARHLVIAVVIYPSIVYTLPIAVAMGFENQSMLFLFFFLFLILLSKRKQNTDIWISEYRQITDKLSSLQEQVEDLFANLNALQSKANAEATLARTSSVGPLDPQISYQGQASPHAPPKRLHPQFPGPASSAYDFNVANNSLQSMGINQPSYVVDEGPNGQEIVIANTASPAMSNVPQQSVNSLKDPLLRIGLEEALRLCRFYDEEIGTTAPILDMEFIITKVRTMYSFMDSMRRLAFLQKGVEQGDSFADDETLILKMILATASTVENGGQSEIGQAIFENVRRHNNIQDRLGQPATIKTLQILTITVRIL
jgi:hypothetical protein